MILFVHPVDNCYIQDNLLSVLSRIYFDDTFLHFFIYLNKSFLHFLHFRGKYLLVETLRDYLRDYFDMFVTSFE